ncbi:MAG: glycerophosphodiester phosphodiesterase [Candidatus Erginobacter occultus]|nr:glycerophosphodiester phosphodiesterase [Candidatus Erginobacter occultus]
MKRKTVLILILAAAVGLLYGLAGSRKPPAPGEFFRSLPAGRPLMIAHRGGAGIFPENTLAAFLGADRLGADILEMDLRRSADGILVVIHDETVDRTTDGSGPVAGFALAELKELDAGYRFRPPDSSGEFPYRGRGLTVPTLREVFSALPGRHLIVEVKEDDPAAADAVIALVREFNRAGITLAASFHPEVLLRFRELSPETATHATRGEVTRFLPAAWLGLEGLFAPDYGAFLVPPREGVIPLTTGRFIRAAKNRNIFTAAWTVNDPAEMRDLLEKGIGGLVTDRPDLARELIGKELELGG